MDTLISFATVSYHDASAVPNCKSFFLIIIFRHHFVATWKLLIRRRIFGFEFVTNYSAYSNRQKLIKTKNRPEYIYFEHRQFTCVVASNTDGIKRQQITWQLAHIQSIINFWGQKVFFFFSRNLAPWKTQKTQGITKNLIFFSQSGYFDSIDFQRCARIRLQLWLFGFHSATLGLNFKTSARIMGWFCVWHVSFSAHVWPFRHLSSEWDRSHRKPHEMYFGTN